MHHYLIALGSNVGHHLHGRPSGVLAAALKALEGEGVEVERASRVFPTDPLGPSRRCFANAAAVVCTDLMPDEMLACLEKIQHDFGRRRGGRRWGERVLDLDIILWDGGPWASPGLAVPHTQFRKRLFVLRPAASIVPGWKDPLTGLSLRNLLARLTKSRPAPR
jgi:2-amino-4-hydroxy-6-hydroxymethyldihydropteridine diphosphokinase